MRAADLRLGIIGTDTSHAPVFTRILNDPSDPEHVSGARVVAAFKGGSPDLPDSAHRVDQFAQELETRWNVKFYPTIEAMLAHVDAVLLESVDGRRHLEQVRPVFAARKPVFVDKPLASTLADALEIARLAKESGTPWFSSSSLRYGALAQQMKVSDASGAITWGPGPVEPHHQLDLSWYAIHPIELLFTLMGPGCLEVVRISSEHADEITGRWKDGRIGSVRAIRPSSPYGAVVFRPKEVLQSPTKVPFSYAPLLREVIRFFQTKVPPVPNSETLEIFAFMDAAQRSKELGGQAVQLPKID